MPKAKLTFVGRFGATGIEFEMGSNTHSDADDCGAEAVEFCWRALGQKPDQITKL